MNDVLLSFSPCSCPSLFRPPLPAFWLCSDTSISENSSSSFINTVYCWEQRHSPHIEYIEYIILDYITPSFQGQLIIVLVRSGWTIAKEHTSKTTTIARQVTLIHSITHIHHVQATINHRCWLSGRSRRVMQSCCCSSALLWSTGEWATFAGTAFKHTHTDMEYHIHIHIS